jgi:hypothetical protein
MWKDKDCVEVGNFYVHQYSLQHDQYAVLLILGCFHH